MMARRNDVNLSAKVARDNCKFPGSLARRAQRNCLNSASMRCVNQKAFLQLLSKSDVRPNAKKCASGVDVTQILRQTCATKFQKFRKSGGPRAQKLRASGQRALRILKETSLKMNESTMRYIPKKLAFGVEITQVLRQFCAKELQNF